MPTFNRITKGRAKVGALLLDGGGAIKAALSGTLAVDPGSIPAQSRGSVTVTLTGAAPGDLLVLEPPAALEAGLAYAGCEVTAADTVRVEIANLTGAAVDGASRTWKYRLVDLT